MGLGDLRRRGCARRPESWVIRRDDLADRVDGDLTAATTPDYLDELVGSSARLSSSEAFLKAVPDPPRPPQPSMSRGTVIVEWTSADPLRHLRGSAARRRCRVRDRRAGYRVLVGPAGQVLSVVRNAIGQVIDARGKGPNSTSIAMLRHALREVDLRHGKHRPLGSHLATVSLAVSRMGLARGIGSSWGTGGSRIRCAQ